jgi:hypothetical protein
MYTNCHEHISWDSYDSMIIFLGILQLGNINDILEELVLIHYAPAKLGRH